MKDNQKELKKLKAEYEALDKQLEPLEQDHNNQYKKIEKLRSKKVEITEQMDRLRYQLKQDATKDLKPGDYLEVAKPGNLDGEVVQLAYKTEDALFCTRPHSIMAFQGKITKQEYDSYWNLEE
ncbi:MAG: hypothetical protein WC525_02995 [Candidatus Thermoplasmatota archaeon]